LRGVGLKKQTLAPFGYGIFVSVSSLWRKTGFLEKGAARMSRPIHFVGSVGGAKDVGGAMDLMLSQREYLLWLPDGEPAERSEYVRNVIEHLATGPGILVNRHPRRVADWKSLRRRTIWKVARGHVLRSDDLRLGYAPAAITSWQVFLEKVLEGTAPICCSRSDFPVPSRSLRWALELTDVGSTIRWYARR
jgi:hypothetical protein